MLHLSSFPSAIKLYCCTQHMADHVKTFAKYALPAKLESVSALSASKHISIKLKIALLVYFYDCVADRCYTCF